MASVDDRQGNEDSSEDRDIGRSIELRPGGQLGAADPHELPVDADFPMFRRLTFLGVLAGACPFLPASFREDRAFEAVCERMVTELGQSRDLGLTPEEVRLLAGGEARPSVPARAAGRLLRLVRRSFPGLAVQDGVRRAVEAFGRGYLLLHAAGLERAELHPPDRTEARVEAVRAAIEATLSAADDRTLRQAMAPAFEESSGLLVRAADVLAGFLGRPADLSGGIAAGSGALAAEGQLLRGLVDQIADSLWSDREALRDLEKPFETHLSRRRGISG